MMEMTAGCCRLGPAPRGFVSVSCSPVRLSSHVPPRRTMLSTDSLERHLLDALPVTIYALDLDGRLTSVHLAASRFGDDSAAQPAPSSETLIGTPVWGATGSGIARDQVEHA